MPGPIRFGRENVGTGWPICAVDEVSEFDDVPLCVTNNETMPMMTTSNAMIAATIKARRDDPPAWGDPCSVFVEEVTKEDVASHCDKEQG